MTSAYDVNMFVGQYPFRELAHTTAEECAAKLAELGFGGAIVSSLEAVFSANAAPLQEKVAQAIARYPQLIHFPIVNPLQPDWKQELEIGMAHGRVRGIRLTGLYHGYGADSKPCAAAMTRARELDLPVLVMCRMQDNRWQRTVRPTEWHEAEITTLLNLYPEQRLILAGLRFASMLKLAPRINTLPDVLLDTSRLQGPWRTFQRLLETLNHERLAFGSLWPINLPECPLTQLRYAAIPEYARQAILSGNFRRWMRITD